MLHCRSHILSVAIVLCILPAILPAQVLFPDAAASRIDTLLLEHRLEEAQQQVERTIAAFDTASADRSLRTAARTEAEEYHSFFRQWEEQSAALDTARVRSIVEPVLSVPERYRAAAAGTASERAFVLMRMSWGNGDARSAFLYCKVANFTRTRFIVRSRSRYRSIIDRVRTVSVERSFTDALSLLDSLVAVESNNPAVGEFRDSVAHWRSTLADVIHDQNVDARKNRSTEVFGRTFGIAAGISPVFSGSRTDVHWRVRPVGFTSTIPVDLSELSGSSGVAGNITLGYYYTPVLSQHLSAEYGSVKQGTVTMADREISVLLTSSIVRFATAMRYAFSSTTGVRNFVSAGAGWSHMVRKEQAIYVGDLVFPGGGRLDKYRLPADEFSSAEVCGEFGAEYLSGSNSDLFLDGSVGFRYRLKEQSVDGAWTVYLTLHAGMFLW